MGSGTGVSSTCRDRDGFEELALGAWPSVELFCVVVEFVTFQ